MEEVKQDLSSFRFEMMNELESQKKEIESAILQVMDLFKLLLQLL